MMCITSKPFHQVDLPSPTSPSTLIWQGVSLPNPSKYNIKHNKGAEQEVTVSRGWSIRWCTLFVNSIISCCSGWARGVHALVRLGRRRSGVIVGSIHVDYSQYHCRYYSPYNYSFAHATVCTIEHRPPCRKSLITVKCTKSKRQQVKNIIINI